MIDLQEVVSAGGIKSLAEEFSEGAAAAAGAVAAVSTTADSGSSTPVKAGSGGCCSPHHRCHSTQETRVQSALDDEVSDIRQALRVGRGEGSFGRELRRGLHGGAAAGAVHDARAGRRHAPRRRPLPRAARGREGVENKHSSDVELTN